MPSIFSAGSASVNIVPDFSGTQKRIGEYFAAQRDIHVKVNPDMDKAQLAGMRAQIETAGHTDVKVGIDRNYLSSSIIKTFDSLVGITTVAKAFEILFGPKSILMVNGVGALTAIAGAASQAGGAIGLLPAGIMAAAAPVATLAVGLSGLSQTMKDAFDPTKAAQFQTELAKLAPAAQGFVQQVTALKPAWESLRLDVQQQLFAGLGNSLTTLANSSLPTLRTGMGQLAGTLGQMGASIANVLSSQANVAAFGQVWASINSTFSILKGALAPITQMMVDLTTVGSQFLPGIATAMTNAANAAANWVAQARQTGQLQAIFQTAIDTIKNLWNVITGLGSILGGVFKAGIADGQLLIGTLGGMLHSIGDFINAPVAQSALKTFFDNILSTVQILRPGIETLVQALITGFLPAISGLANALAPVANTLLTQFANMIKVLAPLIYPALANALNAWFDAISPLIPILTQVMQAILPPLTRAIEALAPTMSTLAGIAGGVLLTAMNAIVPVIDFIGRNILPALSAGLKFLAPILLPIAVAIGVWTAAQWLLNVALAANPIGIIITVIALLAVAIGEIITHIQFFKDVWNTVWSAVRDFFVGIWTAISSWFVSTWDSISSWFTNALHAFIAFWQNIWTSIRDFFVGIWNAIRDFFVNIWNAISSWFAGMLQREVQGWQNIWNAIRDFFVGIWNGIRDFFVNIWNAISSWFAGVLQRELQGWQNIWNSVRDFFVGIWNGISDFFHRTWDGISAWFSGAINGFANFFRSIWNTLSGDIQKIWNGLIGAIQSAWNGIKEIFAAPVRFVINTIVGGLVTGVNDVMGFLHLPWKIPVPHVSFATGGFTGDGMFGTGGKYDPAGVVHAREFVVDQEQTARYRPLLEAIQDRRGGFAQGGYVGDLPGYAGGGLVGNIMGLLSNPVGTLTDLVKSLAGNHLGSGPWADTLLAAPIEMVKNLAGWVGGKIKDGAMALLQAGGKLASDLWGQVSGFFGGLFGGGGGMAGAGVQQWSGVVLQALSMMGQPASLLQTVLRRMNQESGGNVNAVNRTDSNWVRGTPSVGLMQVIGPTYAANKVLDMGPYLYGVSTNPLANVLASMKYAIRQYGSLAAAYNRAGGYDSGGYLPPGWSTVYNGTGRPEPVLTAAEHDALVGWRSTMRRGVSLEDGRTPVWHFYLGGQEITDLVDARMEYREDSTARSLRSSM